MSDIFGRRQQPSRIGGLQHRRRIPVAAHDGDPDAFVARVAYAAREAAIGINREEYLQQVADWATNDRALIHAWRYLSSSGGPAPGIDGMTYDDVPRASVYDELREIRDEIREGRFRPDRLLITKIPKSGPDKFRNLELPTIWDKTVGRAILNAIEPYFKMFFDPRSMGFRPGRDRQLAFAVAEQLSIREERYFWITADVKNAFHSIPRQRFLEILECYLPNAQLMTLVGQLVRRDHRKGIAQGQPLSPLVLNAGLHHLLDRVLRRERPDVPLIRSADDLLILCRTQEEAESAVDLLVKILRQIGVKAKGDLRQAITDIRNVAVEWLGASIRIAEGNTFRWRMPVSARAKLEDRIKHAHRRPDPPIAALQCISGWLDQQGMLLANGAELDDHLHWLRQVAISQAFEEIPDTLELQAIVARGYERFQHIRRIVSENPSLLGSNWNGTQHRSTIRSGPVVELAATPAPGEPILIFTDGSALGPNGPGGWAFIIRRRTAREQVIDCGGVPSTTNNRMELTAAIRALRMLDSGAVVRLVTDSQYLLDCINGRLQRLNDLGELFPATPLRNDLPNLDLLQQLFHQISRIACVAEHVNAHSGHVENEICDRLARNAALAQVVRQNSSLDWI